MREDYTYRKDLVRIDVIDIDTGEFHTEIISRSRWQDKLIRSKDWKTESVAMRMYDDFDFAVEGKKWPDPEDVRLWYIDSTEGKLTRLTTWPDQVSPLVGSAETLIEELIRDATAWLAKSSRARSDREKRAQIRAEILEDERRAMADRKAVREMREEEGEC